MALLNQFKLTDDQDVAYAESWNAIYLALSGNRVISGCAVTEQSTPSLSVDVSGGTVLVAGQVKTVTATTIDLTTEYNGLSTGQARFVYIYVDSTGAVQKLAGTPATDGQQFPPDFGSLPTDCVLLARVKLTQGDTAINTADIEQRHILTAQGIYTPELHVRNSGGGTSQFAWFREETDMNDLSLWYNGSDFEFRSEGNGGGSRYITFSPNGLIYDLPQRYMAPQKAFHGSGNPARSYYNLAHYYETATVTGQIKITMPSNVMDSNKNALMFTLEIEGYNFYDEVDRTAWKIIVSCYTYISSSPFPKYSAWVIYGNPPFAKVKFGNDGSNDFILLGEVTDTWKYPRITITAAHIHYQHYDNLENGWSISRVTTEPTTVYKTISKIYSRTNSLRIGYYNKISGNIVLESDGSAEAGQIEFQGVSGSSNISATSWFIDRQNDALRFFYGAYTFLKMYSDGNIAFQNTQQHTSALVLNRLIQETTYWRYALVPRLADNSNWDFASEFGFDRNKDKWYCDTTFETYGVEGTNLSANQNTQTINPAGWISTTTEQVWDAATSAWVDNSTAGTKHSFTNAVWNKYSSENVYQVIARLFAKIRIDVSEVLFDMGKGSTTSANVTFKWYYSIDGGTNWVEGGSYTTALVTATGQSTNWNYTYVDVYGKDVTGTILVKLTLSVDAADPLNTVDVTSFTSRYKIALGAI